MQRITSPDDPALGALCDELASRAAALDRSGEWPAAQLRLLGEAGVYEWFAPKADQAPGGRDHPASGQAENDKGWNGQAWNGQAWSGQGWSEQELARGYVALSAACLTTTFILTQRVGATKRVLASDNLELREALMPGLVSGESFATVGVSHLTTSRRHLSRPALVAKRQGAGWRLDGCAPWVTGAQHADTVVVGAAVVDDAGAPTGDEILVALPATLAGVSADEPFPMVALSASRTGALRVRGVEAGDELVVAGPAEHVMQSGVGARPGGHQTSALAVGAARASIDLLRDEASRRPDLVPPTDSLAQEHRRLEADLYAAARGEPAVSSESLRQRANSLALRASQAALTATKGAGYLAEAPAGRLCREALFFLVWSCPQPVQNASLCELAGLGF